MVSIYIFSKFALTRKQIDTQTTRPKLAYPNAYHQQVTGDISEVCLLNPVGQ